MPVLICSDAALLGQEAQLLQHPGHTRENTCAVSSLHAQSPRLPENKWRSHSDIWLVELRGLEPLTFSLRRLLLHCRESPPASVAVHKMHGDSSSLSLGHTGGTPPHAAPTASVIAGLSSHLGRRFSMTKVRILSVRWAAT